LHPRYFVVNDSTVFAECKTVKNLKFAVLVKVLESIAFTSGTKEVSFYRTVICFFFAGHKKEDDTQA